MSYQKIMSRYSRLIMARKANKRAKMGAEEEKNQFRPWCVGVAQDKCSSRLFTSRHMISYAVMCRRQERKIVNKVVGNCALEMSREEKRKRKRRFTSRHQSSFEKHVSCIIQIWCATCWRCLKSARGVKSDGKSRWCRGREVEGRLHMASRCRRWDEVLSVADTLTSLVAHYYC